MIEDTRRGRLIEVKVPPLNEYTEEAYITRLVDSIDAAVVKDIKHCVSVVGKTMRQQKRHVEKEALILQYLPIYHEGICYLADESKTLYSLLQYHGYFEIQFISNSPKQFLTYRFLNRPVAIQGELHLPFWDFTLRRGIYMGKANIPLID